MHYTNSALFYSALRSQAKLTIIFSQNTSDNTIFEFNYIHILLSDFLKTWIQLASANGIVIQFAPHVTSIPSLRLLWENLMIFQKDDYKSSETNKERFQIISN